MANKELTLIQVRDGIILSLKKAYPNAAIRSDRTLQSVKDGDFNVLFVAFGEPEKLGNIAKITATFDVVYYADRDNVTDDLLRVSTDLPLLLETIKTPSGVKIHPDGMIEPSVQDDDSLHCLVRYAYRVDARRVTIDDEGHIVVDTDLMRILDLRMPPIQEGTYG